MGTLYRKLYIPRIETTRRVPDFYIHVSGSNLYISTIGLIWNLYFLYCVRELSAQPQEQREGQGTAAKQWLVAVPCLPSAPVVELRVHIIDKHTNFQFGKLRVKL
jgi:hypothetical protein